MSPSARTRLRLPDGGADTGAKIEVITLIAAGDRAEDDRNVLPVNVRVSEG